MLAAISSGRQATSGSARGLDARQANAKPERIQGNCYRGSQHQHSRDRQQQLQCEHFPSPFGFLCSPRLLVPGHGAISSRTSPPNVNSSNRSAATTGNRTAPRPFIASVSRFMARLRYRVAATATATIGTAAGLVFAVLLASAAGAGAVVVGSAWAVSAGCVAGADRFSALPNSWAVSSLR